jgi:hypothetical protein
VKRKPKSESICTYSVALCVGANCLCSIMLGGWVGVSAQVSGCLHACVAGGGSKAACEHTISSPSPVTERQKVATVKCEPNSECDGRWFLVGGWGGGRAHFLNC